MIRRARDGCSLVRCLGLRWLGERLRCELRLRSGLLRRQTPVADWEEKPLHRFLQDPDLAEPEAYREYRRRKGPPFFFDPAQRTRFAPLFPQWDRGPVTPQRLARGMTEGRFLYFGRTTVSLSQPPDWHANPFTGQRAPADRHWTEIDEFASGDVKAIWEMSRFGFAYTLVRAYWRTGKGEYAELFWRLVEDWRRKNRPQEGVNWKCGQEVSLRSMAWIFGLYGFLEAPSTTPARVRALAQMLAVSGERIAANLDYALSQRNNHGISEGLGLWSIGVLFPELAPAALWRERGRTVLEELGRELIYDDGSFAQHSVNYHRLMLQDYLWALRLGEIHDRPFSPELRSRVGRAGDFLAQLQDRATGLAPCYGANDGALILPLNNCDFPDMRPVTLAAGYLLAGTRSWDHGPWEEDLLWLFGPEALQSPRKIVPPADWQAPQGGYYTLRTPQSHVFTRCASRFRHRPSQADALHVDLWWRGQNIALDAGTCAYNGPPPWNNPLAGTLCHNTVSVDGADQMRRVSRFLWLPWPRGRVRVSPASPGNPFICLEGEHDGYRRLNPPVRHRRSIVCLADGWWLVVDRLSSRAAHAYRLHWLFPDVPYSWEEGAGLLRLETPSGPYCATTASTARDPSRSLVRADEETPRGWKAPFYGSREPALSLSLTVCAPSTFFWTLFGPEPGKALWDRDRLGVKAPGWEAFVELQADPSSPLVRSRGRRAGVELPGSPAPCIFS